MGIKSWGDCPSNLFDAVNESWKGDKTVFNYLPTYADAATMIVDGLLPNLCSEYGAKVLRLLPPTRVLKNTTGFGTKSIIRLKTLKAKF